MNGTFNRSQHKEKLGTKHISFPFTALSPPRTAFELKGMSFWESREKEREREGKREREKERKTGFKQFK